MARNDDLDGSYPVPGHRLGRLMRLGGMTTGILGDMVASGVRQAAQGQRPRLPGLLLTPATARRVTRDLGQMRGAAMKLGQMLSMDTGLVLPPEMTAIMAALRAEAPHMPPKQLQSVLNAAWGTGWYGRFKRFDLRPFAAASIGQVHRAQTLDGRDLAIKVQYPGVRASIDSDIDNLATLLRVPGVVPREMDLGPMLREAKAQLHQEADYLSEARHLTAFQTRLAGSDAFRLPDLHTDLSTPHVLAMSYIESQPIDALIDAAQDLRDHIARHLIALTLRELFDFGLMQTDPNLANYRFDTASRRIVLLDFGAVMAIAPDLTQDFRGLLNAALACDAARTRAAMLRIGYFDAATSTRHQDLILEMFNAAMAPLRQSTPFDFGSADLMQTLRDMGLAMGSERDLTHVPPPATMFLHRKIGGMYLLATKLRARVALRPMLERYP
ncbi:ABC1 kinase family protein [Roseovarius sp. 217]|uniref:ABC1 kinase family protein n=1 Tax=Roseovarius sp. (strain 217) TaxID=314264 RepID=UPI0000685BC6|nr:AarF/ABC1/UbiB kinase family protein [Roseovarius sp. 217]EAQ26398.1 putative ubiquinol-cytochrome-c reductase assembly protein [Roseovarius sp. 217]